MAHWALSLLPSDHLRAPGAWESLCCRPLSATSNRLRRLEPCISKYRCLAGCTMKLRCACDVNNNNNQKKKTYSKSLYTTHVLEQTVTFPTPTPWFTTNMCDRQITGYSYFRQRHIELQERVAMEEARNYCGGWMQWRSPHTKECNRRAISFIDCRASLSLNANNECIGQRQQWRGT